MTLTWFWIVFLCGSLWRDAAHHFAILASAKGRNRQVANGC